MHGRTRSWCLTLILALALARCGGSSRGDEDTALDIVDTSAPDLVEVDTAKPEDTTPEVEDIPEDVDEDAAPEIDTKPPPECVVDEDCLELLSAEGPCERVACRQPQGECVVEPVTPGTPCDDGDACTQGEICVGWSCEPDSVETCGDGDPCTQDICDPITGACANPEKDCDDGVACTVDSCHEQVGCVHQATPECGAPCDDDLGACDDGDPCTVATCVPCPDCEAHPHQCVFTPYTCDDGHDCTDDLCLDDVDGDGVGDCDFLLNCEEDQDACTEAACDEGSAWECVHQPLDPALVDDGDPCTIDACDPAGGPTHDFVTCPNADPCMIATCDSEAGGCVSTPKVCVDEDPCTMDSCQALTGACRHEAYVCDDQDPCTVDACDAESDGCLYAPKDCDDDDPCTIDSCEPLSGFCLTQDVVCDDGVPCTTDSCDPASGDCLFQALACADGDLCTVDACDPETGACMNPPVDCDDGDACTTDACLPESGDCQSIPMDCDDQDPCTLDSCQGGACEAVPVDCDDGDPCTEDQCDSVSGDCAHAPLDCDDDDPCTTDTCDGAGGCLHEIVICDDGSLCTADYCHPVDGSCVATPKNCDDQIIGTTDACDEATGACTHVYAGLACEDASTCEGQAHVGCPGAWVCDGTCSWSCPSPLHLWDMPPILDAGTLDLEVVATTVEQREDLTPPFIHGYEVQEIWFSSTEWASGEAETIRIHGFVATPQGVSGAVPGVVGLHGLGGMSSAKSAADLAHLIGGVVVIGIDGPGHGVSEGTGPAQDPHSLFAAIPEARASFFFGYAHAAMRAITVLTAQPLVDDARVGITGYSGGGVTTYLVNGVDARVKAAVPQSATGDLVLAAQHGGWEVQLLAQADMTAASPEFTGPWRAASDPLSYAPHARGATLMINGAQDEFFPLPSTVNTYAAITGVEKRLLVIRNWDHGPLALVSDYHDHAVDVSEDALRFWMRHFLHEDPSYATLPAEPGASLSSIEIPGLGSFAAFAATTTGLPDDAEVWFNASNDGAALFGGVELDALGAGAYGKPASLTEPWPFPADAWNADNTVYFAEIAVPVGGLLSGESLHLTSVPALYEGFAPYIYPMP